ncbi:MAG: type II CAAX endopeptidase family protein [Xanthobacteraceae bacterium]|nr:type II CAAX endopeptidase family protein [Xanthobacteraceae bacterium]
MRIWGYWATLGWAFLAFFASQFVALAVLLLLRLSDLNSILNTPFDGAMVTLFIIIANPVTIGVIALAVRLAHARQAEYLALKAPPRRDLRLGLVCLVGLIVASDALLYFSGYPLVTPFQLQSYTTAAAQGWLPGLLLGAVVVAPAGEEVLFRGFLFRGWARTAFSTWFAIPAISLLWMALHVQYDWTGMLQIFVIGLFLGWMRWRSGSLLLTFLLHALFNLEGTLETVLQIRFFS